MKFIRTVALYCFIFLCTNISVAQQSKSFNNLKQNKNETKTYTTNDGLPSRNTTATLRDKRGFIWVGTENGLCRFDGYAFKIFSNKLGDTTSLTNNFVNAIVEDRTGKIWVATMDGLNLLDPLTETFTRFLHNDKIPNSLSNNKVWSVLCDRAGEIWVGTDDGFNQFIPNRKEFFSFKPNPSKSGSMMGKSVNSIVEDAKGDLWLGNWSAGLNRFDKKKRTFTNFAQYQKPGFKNPNDVWALCYASDGTIWVGTYWDGLFSFNPKTSKFSKITIPDQENYSVFSILVASKDLLLVGGNNGFYWYNIPTKTWDKIKDVQNYSYGDAYKDKDGIIWVNAINGLRKIDHQQYKFNLNLLPLGNRETKSMVILDSVVWLGTNNGLFKVDKRFGRLTAFTKNKNPNSLTSNEIQKLYIDSKKVLWVLTENGFDSYDEKNNQFKHHYHHSAIGNLFNEDVFRDILEIENGIYVLATDAGLKIYDSNKNQFKHYYNQPKNPYSINNNHTYALSKAPDGKIWVGTYGGGVNIFDSKTSRFSSIETATSGNKGLSNNIVKAIFTDSKKNIWVCTSDGLNKYVASENRFHIYAKMDGFSSNVFNDIAEDTNGKIWLATENGISSLDPTTNKVRNFDEADGVAVNSIIRSNGKLIFVAGNKGYFSFDPQRLNFNKAAPPVYFTDFQLFNKSVFPSVEGPLNENLNIAKQITLNYDQSVFSLEFVALNYAYPWKNGYAYKLVGFDKKWNYVGNQRKATYTNLNPGTYRFQVKASNNDGVWNDTGTSIIIKINPPWYLTWWAYLVYAIAIALSVYLYVSYRRKQDELKYEIKIAHIESEKEKELNERKLSFFTNISHEFRTPLTLIINPVKELLYQDDKNLDTSSMNIVYRNAKRLLSLVDQLLLFRKADSQGDTLKASNLNLVSLVKEVFLCFAHQARTKAINYEFICKVDKLTILADREKLEIAIFNLLSNAFKFTPDGGAITVNITETEDSANILIADTGCGIREDLTEKIFNRFYQETDQYRSAVSGFGIGLYLVKNFIEMHSGSVKCQNNEGDGTSFTVQLLKGSEHINPAFIIEDQQESSTFLKELNQDDLIAEPTKKKQVVLSDMLSQEKKSILIIDDNEEIANYLSEVFAQQYQIYQARDGESGLAIIREFLPDVVISDVMMQGMGGIELCSIVKEDESICHIPVVLLTASTSAEIKLKGVESGADDYISKPFDKELLMARIGGILKNKNSLQKYFYSEITLNPSRSKISSEYKDFLKTCIHIVEHNIEDPNFNIKMLAEEIGMSRANLFNKIKSISGHSSNSFIRFIRLKKAAEIFISSDKTIQETMYMVGMSDIKYFREQFKKVFEINPSDYIKKYRKNFTNNSSLDLDLKKNKN
jgi:signal transduction histidine kinase/ligand-binding sensor domain-containing protein/DNA-binding response OmpR family regulator